MIKCHFREADPISKDEYNKTIKHRCKSLDGHNENIGTYSANNLSPETESSLTLKFSERIQNHPVEENRALGMLSKVIIGDTTISLYYDYCNHGNILLIVAKYF